MYICIYIYIYIYMYIYIYIYKGPFSTSDFFSRESTFFAAIFFRLSTFFTIARETRILNASK